MTASAQAEAVVDRRRVMEVALGRAPADLVVEGGTLVNVLSGEIYRADVAIVGETIAATGSIEGMIGPDTMRVQATGRHIVPGLIDEHLHTYETHLTPAALAPPMLTHGVTTIATDFYGEAVVAGKSAIKLQLENAKDLPINFLWTLPMPAFYQDEPFLHTGSLDAADMREMLTWPECIGVNECFAGFVLRGDEVLLELMELARSLGKILCGHASEVRGNEAKAWAAYGGYLDDHECVDPDEVVEKARAGVRIVLREGSGVSDVVNCLPAITRSGLDPRRFSFCSDLLSPVDLLRRGDIDYCVRLAIEGGVPVIDAIRMGSLNAAETLGVDRRLGSVAPGKQADLCLVDAPLEKFVITDVFVKGRQVVADGAYCGPQTKVAYPESARQTVKLGAPLTAESFDIPAAGPDDAVQVRVIGVHDGSLITDELLITVGVRDGVLAAEPGSGVNKVASFERHGKTGLVGLGFVKGYGLAAGAVASTYNPHCQNLVVVGADDEDMALVATTVAEMGGGFAVVRDGEVLAKVPLPLYGLISDSPAAEVVAQIEAAFEAIHSLGSELSAPFHTLAFLGLPVVIGKLKISSLGLIDVWAGEVVGLEVPPVVST